MFVGERILIFGRWTNYEVDHILYPQLLHYQNQSRIVEKGNA